MAPVSWVLRLMPLAPEIVEAILNAAASGFDAGGADEAFALRWGGRGNAA